MGNPNMDALQKTLRDVVVSLVPNTFKVIWLQQNAPRPVTPYITLHWAPGRKLGRDVQGAVDGTTLNAPLLGTREPEVDVQGFGPGSLQALEDLRTLLDTVAATEALFEGGIAVVDAGPLLNLMGLYDQQMKERGQFELKLRVHSYLATGDAGVGYIQAVEETVTDKLPDGSEVSDTQTVGTPA